jgi:glycosyltransferase involved in cell wall biosynthesis
VTTTSRRPRRTPWPEHVAAAAGSRQPVGIVVATFNTRSLIAQCVFALYRLLGRDQFSELVVVDNGSNDGSRELLGALHRAGLAHLIRNRRQRYHGPALTQGISWLARGQKSGSCRRVDYVWVLDSDVIVLRSDTVRDALAAARRLDAAVVGQSLGDDTYSSLLTNNGEMLNPCSMLFDPRRIWRSPIPPFLEDGAPATALQVAADACGLRLLDFPFLDDGYVLHLGRGTLREVARSGNAENRYYAWALDHHKPHFSGQERGEDRYRGFCEFFDAEVGELTPENLVAACKHTSV